MKNIFLILKQIFVLLSLVGPLVSQGAIHKNQKLNLNQAIVFEIFEAIKNGDSKNYEGLFYELAASLESPREFRRLLSMTDEAGNNIFHLMASVPPESPAFRFFLKEMGSLLVFLTLPKRYYDSLSLNPPSFGGMSYEEMPRTIIRNQGSMKLESVIKDFLQKENNKGETPLTIAQQDNKIPRDYNALEQFNNMYVNIIYERDKYLKFFNDEKLGAGSFILLTVLAIAMGSGMGLMLAMFIAGSMAGWPEFFEEWATFHTVGASAGALSGLISFLSVSDFQVELERNSDKCYEAIARWKANIDHI